MENSIIIFLFPLKEKTHYHVKVKYDLTIINKLRKISGAKWQPKYRVWSIPVSEENQRHLSEIFPEVKIPDGPAPRANTGEILNELEIFRQYLQTKRFSKHTVKSYTEAIKLFLEFFNGNNMEELTNDDVNSFFHDYCFKRNLSISWQRLMVNAIKHYFEKFKRKRLEVNYLYLPKKDKNLPNVLSKEEVQEILRNAGNLKHKTMLSLIYCCGLRRGELLALKPEHIDTNRNILIIKMAKGRKDRITPLPKRMIDQLKEYITKYSPLLWLFEGQKPGEPYHERSLAKVLETAVKKSKITKPVSLHWLRHSYATHLLESGTDLRYIQELLGHSSSRTTEIYTHVSTQKIAEIRSPFEDLDM